MELDHKVGSKCNQNVNVALLIKIVIRIRFYVA
jgi:hypothetical protein